MDAARMKDRLAALFAVDAASPPSTPATTAPPSPSPSFSSASSSVVAGAASSSPSAALGSDAAAQSVSTWLGVLGDEALSDEARMSAARKLTASLSEVRVSEAETLLRVWRVAHDLLARVRVEERDVPLALVLALLRACAVDEVLDALRSDVLSALVGAGDSGAHADALRVDALALLTRGGKRVPAALAERLCACVADWLAHMAASERLLALVHALVKYHAALVSEGGLARIVQRVCALADETRDEALLGHCLRVLDAAVRYARVPLPTRDAFVSTLCRAVNVERFSDASWAILAMHLQDRAGVALVQRLCAVLDDAALYAQVPLLRGAVFFLSMALWGSQRVAALDVAPASVLPSLARVLACRHHIVAYEVALVLRRLVKKRGLTLAVEWHLVGRLLALFRPYVSAVSAGAGAGAGAGDEAQAQANLVGVLGDVLDVLEEQYLAKAFVGMGIKGTLISALETFVPVRAEKHAFFLLRVYLDDLAPEHDGWLSTLRTLLSTYFVREQRAPIRLRALEVARMLYDRHAHFYAAELAEAAVLSFLPTIYLDADAAVRDAGLRLVVHVARSLRETKPFVDLCAILVRAASDALVASETRLSAVAGLTALLHDKFAHSRFAHTLLVLEHLRTLAHHDDVAVRRHVLGELLQLRASSRGYLQLANVPSLYVRVGARGKEQVGVYDMQGLVDVLAARLLAESRLELLSAVLRALQQLALNHYALRSLSVAALVGSLCDLLAARALGAQAQLAPDQQRELTHMGYELLTLLLPYALRNAAADDAERLALRAVSALLAGLHWDDAPAPAHAIILTRAWHKAPAQASFVVSYYCLLCEEHAALLARLDAAHVTLALQTLLAFVDRSQGVGAAKVSQAYRAMTLLFLALPLARRAAYLDVLVPPLRAHVHTQHCALAEVQLDLLARYAWTDVEPAPLPRAEDASLFFASAARQHYAHGGATVLEVTAGRLGWARVKVRRATGTMLWSMQLQNEVRLRARPAHRAHADALSELVHAVEPLVAHTHAHTSLPPPTPTSSPHVLRPESPPTPRPAPEPEPALSAVTEQVRRLAAAAPRAPPPVTLPPLDDAHAHITHVDAHRTHVDAHRTHVDVPLPHNEGDGPHASALQDFTAAPQAEVAVLETAAEDVAVVELVGPTAHPLRNSPEHTAAAPSTAPASPRESVPTPLRERQAPPAARSPAAAHTADDAAVTASAAASASASASVSATSSAASTPPASPPLRPASPRDHADAQSQRSGARRSVGTAPHTAPLPRSPAVRGNVALFKTTPLHSPRAADSPVLSRRASTHTDSPLRTSSDGEAATASASAVASAASAVHPGVVFLQLQQLALEPGATSVRMEPSDALTRSLSVLDRMLSVETHKFGVLYVRAGQSAQNEILANASGSPLYLRFLQLLGRLVRLRELPEGTYTAGLDRSEDALDGEYSLMWSNEVTQVMYHVVTMMPTRTSDAACTAKKRHVGNDYVHIVFDESGAQSYDLDTVTGQFTLAVITVVPLDGQLYRVSVARKPPVAQFGPLLPAQIVPEAQLGELVRQTAINGNIACLMHQEEKGLPFVAHSEERLAQLKQIVERFGKPALKT